MISSDTLLCCTTTLGLKWWVVMDGSYSREKVPRMYWSVIDVFPTPAGPNITIFMSQRFRQCTDENDDLDGTVVRVSIFY